MASAIDLLFSVFSSHLRRQMRTTYAHLFNVSLFVQELMFYLMVAKILCYYLHGMEVMQVIQADDLPPLLWCEYVWCCSVIIPPFFRSRFIAIVTLFGVIPMAYGFTYYLADWIIHKESEDGSALMWKGVPLVLLMNPIYIFIIIVQGFSIYIHWMLHN